jgi:hypothetical protein
MPFYDAGELMLQHQGIAADNQLKQLGIQEAQQEIQDKQKVREILGQTPVPTLAQQGAEVSQPGTVDRAPIINSLQQRSQELLKKSQDIQAYNPKLALDMGNQADKLQDTARQLSVQQLNEQKEIAHSIAGILSPVRDQTSLDTARQIMDSQHRGLWKAQGLPDVYDATTGPKFQQWSLLATDKQEQLDIAIKSAEAEYAARRAKDTVEKLEQDIRTSRALEAQRQAGIKAKSVAHTAEEQYRKEDEKEDLLYQTSMQKERAAIFKDTKKYPAEAPKPTLKESIWAHTFGDPLVPELSAQEKALARVAREQAVAHEARKQAIRNKAIKSGVVLVDKYGEQDTGTKSPVGGSKKEAQFVSGKIYTDANGNKAKWNGSDWEPQ